MKTLNDSFSIKISDKEELYSLLYQAFDEDARIILEDMKD